MTRHALFLTELFNDSVDSVVEIGDSASDGLPVDRVAVRSGGRLVRTDGKPLLADYVVTQPQVELEGRRLAQGTGAHLALWKTGGAVKLADPPLNARQLVSVLCG